MSIGVFVNGTTSETIVRDLTVSEVAAITQTDAERLAIAQADCTINRRGAYAAESDPLYFLWQRGEGTQADWLTAVADIRTRYPMPDA